jgi:uncharacterized protein (DUF924 family)
MPFDATLPARLKAHLSPPEAVVASWRHRGFPVWFGKDQHFHETFAIKHDAAAKGELMPWLDTAEGALSLVILLDQYPRNSFRGTARMYAIDLLARDVADMALRLGHDNGVEPDLRLFFCLPFARSERLPDQLLSVALGQDLPAPTPEQSRRHHDIIARFGRFPHRNAILGRETTVEESSWPAAGGYAG